MAKRIRGLDTSTGILCEMRRIYRAGRTGEMKLNECTGLYNMLTQMNKVIDTSILESRVVALEKAKRPVNGTN